MTGITQLKERDKNLEEQEIQQYLWIESVARRAYSDEGAAGKRSCISEMTHQGAWPRATRSIFA